MEPAIEPFCVSRRGKALPAEDTNLAVLIRPRAAIPSSRPQTRRRFRDVRRLNGPGPGATGPAVAVWRRDLVQKAKASPMFRALDCVLIRNPPIGGTCWNERTSLISGDKKSGCGDCSGLNHASPSILVHCVCAEVDYALG
jgi:hypothetical protein